MFLSIDKDDMRLWSCDPKGQFFVTYFYNVLIGERAIIPSWKFHWNKFVAPRVTVFYWVARLQKIVTVNNLKKRGHILVNRCSLLCLTE